MSYQTVPTVATGDSWTAAQHNTYIRDNFTALWPYTDAGDIAYATSATTLGKVGIGTAAQILTSDGSGLTWTDYELSKGVMLIADADQAVPKNVLTDIVWISALMNYSGCWTSGAGFTVPVTGIYRLDGSVKFASNSTGTRVIALYDGTTTTYIDARVALPQGIHYSSFSYTYLFDSTKTYTFQVRQDTLANLATNASIGLTYIGAS